MNCIEFHLIAGAMQRRVVTLKWADISEVRTAYIIREMNSEMSVHFNVTTRRHIPEDSKRNCFVRSGVQLLL
jgi:hypothetical protein